MNGKETTNQPINVAILGATGSVGQELLKILEERDFPIKNLKLLASAKSKNTSVTFKGKQYQVEEATRDSFQNIDIVFSAAGASVSKELALIAIEAGAIVIDKTSAFRMEPTVPLVVPEVNGHALKEHHGLISVPNCSTSQLVVALKPLHDLAGLSRVVVSTYQSVSGAGKKAINELEQQTKAIVQNQEYPPSIFQKQIAFNLIPQIDQFLSDGYTKEEDKLIQETRKILNLPNLPITCTAVRVPVLISHSESVLCEFERPISPAQARETLANSSSIEIWDNPEKCHYPTPLDAAGKDPVYIGRIRRDTSSENGLHLWVVADNLRIGAALNAIHIAEYLLTNNLLRQPIINS